MLLPFSGKKSGFIVYYLHHGDLQAKKVLVVKGIIYLCFLFNFTTYEILRHFLLLLLVCSTNVSGSPILYEALAALTFHLLYYLLNKQLYVGPNTQHRYFTYQYVFFIN
jgi:hypothetical protein